MSWSFYWRDPDGAETQLGQITSSKVISFSGLSMVPIEHFLQEIPSQDRQLYRGLRFRPRIVQLELVNRQSSASAQDTFHTTLLAALNPDRGAGVLKIVLSDGSTTRYLDCYVQEGPDFLSQGRPRAGGDQVYMVRFVAPNPFIHGASPQSGSSNFNGATPVDVTISNLGHVDTFPTLVITGVVTNPKVLMLTTGEYLEFSYALTAGHHLDIDCQEGVVNYDNAEMSPLALTKQSTLFSIPRAVAAQTLRLTATSGTGAFSYSFENLYLGI